MRREVLSPGEHHPIRVRTLSGRAYAPYPGSVILRAIAHYSRALPGNLPEGCEGTPSNWADEFTADSRRGLPTGTQLPIVPHASHGTARKNDFEFVVSMSMYIRGALTERLREYPRCVTASLAVVLNPFNLSCFDHP